ncbi:hypothetical protein J3454_03030 [Erythrobacter sp. NFXS35]|uniref:hypothetical protein n=1 Tax=Erythrobacter sp. NFXS35 TaxID=2818436 RepID=UPI0032DFCCCD
MIVLLLKVLRVGALFFNREKIAGVPRVRVSRATTPPGRHQFMIHPLAITMPINASAIKRQQVDRVRASVWGALGPARP